MIRSKIKNGVNFYSEFNDKFKTNMFVVNFTIPLNSKNAASFSLLSEIMKRGFVKYPTYLEFSKKLEELYSSSFGNFVYKKGECLCFGIYSSFLDKQFVPDDIDLMSENVDILYNYVIHPLIVDGAFNPDYISQEKVNLINRIKEKINDKGSYSVNRCIALMCEDEEYAVASTGTVEDVENITNDDLVNAYHKLINEAIVDIYYLGSDSHDNVEGVVSNFSSSLPERDDPNYPITEVIKNKNNLRSITESINATQGKLVLGIRTQTTLSDDDYPALIVFNEILGASPISKLFMNVREKLSLCYYCYSYLDAIKGLMFICSGIDVNDYQKALDAILNEITAICDGNISKEEFLASKTSLKNTYREINDSPFSLLNWYHTRHISNVEHTPQSFSDAIEAVLVDDVIKVAKNIHLELIYFLKGESK